MYRIALSLLTLLTLAGAGASAAAVQTKAPYALLIDSSSGRVLLQKNADAPMAPASTTKILTAEVVFSELASGRLKLDDTFLVSARAASEGDAESGGSSMFAEAGSRARVEDLLRGLLIVSGNDAAITLAEGIAGTETAFAGLMNAQARAIGMTHSHFANPWGGPGNRVTARDMARLASYVIATYPQYYRYFGESEFTWNGVRQQNRNPLLQVGADGLKTGASRGERLWARRVGRARRPQAHPGVERPEVGEGAGKRRSAASRVGVSGSALTHLAKVHRFLCLQRHHPPQAASAARPPSFRIGSAGPFSSGMRIPSAGPPPKGRKVNLLREGSMRLGRRQSLAESCDTRAADVYAPLTGLILAVTAPGATPRPTPARIAPVTSCEALGKSDLTDLDSRLSSTATVTRNGHTPSATSKVHQSGDAVRDAAAAGNLARRLSATRLRRTLRPDQCEPR